jgi:hypothetical protein
VPRSAASPRQLDRHAGFQRIDRVSELDELVAQIERAGAGIADQRAAALLARDAALSFQHVERVTHDAAADADLLGQDTFGGRRPAVCTSPTSMRARKRLSAVSLARAVEKVVPRNAFVPGVRGSMLTYCPPMRAFIRAS